MDDKDAEIRELRDRLARLENAPAPTSPGKKTGTGWGCAGPLIGAAVIVPLILTLGMCASDSQLDEPARSDWTPPAGFSVFLGARSQGAVAYEWSRATRAECRGTRSSCWAINFVTEDGCSRSLYASITLLSATDQNIGWTNDTAQGVQAGEVTRMVFSTYEQGAVSARLAEVSCY